MVVSMDLWDVLHLFCKGTEKGSEICSGVSSTLNCSYDSVRSEIGLRILGFSFLESSSLDPAVLNEKRR